MAKSAKDPVSPAEPAASSEAASSEAASSEVTAPGATAPGAEPATVAEAEPGAGPEAEPGAAADDLDETKRKFREALDRKKQAHASDQAAAGNRVAGKAHGAGGPATSRRQFRRKSG
jgi:hypothetical protein